MDFLTLLTLILLQTTQMQTGQSELQVTGTKVLFFGPTQAERDSVIRTEGIEAGAAFDDFDYYTAKATAYLKGRRIPAEFTTRTSILVRIGEHGIRKIDRKKIPDFIGVILTDGVQEPRLIQGIATDEELIGEINDFFRLK